MRHRTSRTESFQLPMPQMCLRSFGRTDRSRGLRHRRKEVLESSYRLGESLEKLGTRLQKADERTDGARLQPSARILHRSPRTLVSVHRPSKVTATMHAIFKERAERDNIEPVGGVLRFGARSTADRTMERVG